MRPAAGGAKTRVFGRSKRLRSRCPAVSVKQRAAPAERRQYILTGKLRPRESIEKIAPEQIGFIPVPHAGQE